MGRGSTIRYVSGALLLVAAYVGVILHQGPRAKETFPVFQWELFSKVPDRVRSDYAFRLTEVDGRVLFFPRYYEDAIGLVPEPRAIEASTLARSMGSAAARGDDALVADRREVFEARFLASKQSVTYDLVRRTYDVKDRIDCGCFLAEDVVATFELGREA